MVAGMADSDTKETGRHALSAAVWVTFSHQSAADVLLSTTMPVTSESLVYFKQEMGSSIFIASHWQQAGPDKAAEF